MDAAVKRLLITPIFMLVIILIGSSLALALSLEGYYGTDLYMVITLLIVLISPPIALKTAGKIFPGHNWNFDKKGRIRLPHL